MASDGQAVEKEAPQAAVDAAVANAPPGTGPVGLEGFGPGRLSLGLQRGGGAVLARQLKALQQASGNAATGRVLARSHKQAVGTQSGTIGEIAARLSAKYSKSPKDIIGVMSDGYLYLFAPGSPPTQIGKPLLAATRDLRNEKEFEPFPLGPGVYSIGTPAHSMSYQAVKDVYDDGKVGPEHFEWSTGWSVFGFTNKLLVDPSELSKLNAVIPSEGAFYLGIPRADEVEIEVVVHAEYGPNWGLDRWKVLESRLKAEAKKDDKTPADGSMPPKDSVSYSVPDRTVPYKQGEDWYINVWVGKLHKPLKLEKDESLAKLTARVHTAARKLRAARDPANSTRVKGTKDAPATFDPALGEGEIDVSTGESFDATGGKGTTGDPPFPARIVSHGPEGRVGNTEFERTVTGASVDFTMDLDYAAVTSGFWEEFGARWQVIEYRWELIDISKLDLAAVRGKLTGKTAVELRQQRRALRDAADAMEEGEEKTKALNEANELDAQLDKLHEEADSGVGRDLVRSAANTWDDTKKDLRNIATSPAALQYLSVVAISDIVQLGGALIKAPISLLAAPTSNRKVGFNRSGMFLLRCYAQPVVTERDLERIEAKGLRPIIRPASVAILPVEVIDINKRATQVNDAELDQIRTLEAQVEHPPFPYSRADVQKRLDTLLATKKANNEEAIRLSIAHAEAELEQIKTWRELGDKHVALEDRGDALRQWHATLDMTGIDMDQYAATLRQNLATLNQTLTRVTTGFGVSKLTGTVYRPRITLISELDGQAYPIMANLARDAEAGPGQIRWRLNDLTSPTTQQTFVGKGATNQEALRDLFLEFAEKNEYGRGSIAVRLPESLATDLGESIVITPLLVSAPGDEDRAWRRLEDLATAAMIAGLFITGPIGIGIGAAGGILGGAVAIHNMSKRASGDRLKLMDFQTGMDILAVVGAVAGVVGPLAKGVQGAAETAHLTALASRARMIGGAMHVLGVGMLAGQVIIIPAALITTLKSIEEAEQADLAASVARGGSRPVNESKYRAQRFEAWANFVMQGAIAIRSVHLMADENAGWNPMKQPTGQQLTPAQLRGMRAADGLPPDLKGRISVEVDTKLGSTNTVSVSHDPPDPKTGTIRNVRIRVGTGATGQDVALHAPTARAMLGFQGLSGRVYLLLERINTMLGGKDPKLFSKAWEARMELTKLRPIIADRVEQLTDPRRTPAERDDLLTELEMLEAQVAEHQQTVADMNVDPGTGDIMAKGITKAQERAKQEGMPDLDKGYHYRFREGGWEVIRDDPNLPALRFDPKTKTLVPYAGPAPEPAFPAGTTKEAAFKALGGDALDREFGKWVDVVANDLQIESVTKLTNRIGDPSGRTPRTIRNRVKDPLTAEIVKKLTTPEWLRTRESYTKATGRGLGDSEALLAASHEEMLRVTKKLAVEDSGSIAEFWYRDSYAADKTSRQVSAPATQFGLTEDRRIDLMDGNTLRELKNVAGALDPRARGQVLDMIKLLKQSIEVKAGDVRTVDKIVVSFLNPAGIKANAAFMREVLNNPANKGKPIAFEIFNAVGQRMEITAANVAFLGEPGLTKWVTGAAPAPAPAPAAR